MAVTDALVWGVFVLTYIGMAAGRVPGLAIDRAGLTLSGLIVLIVAGVQPVAHIAAVLALPTLLLLFALMLVAAHFELARGFDWIADYLVGLDASPRLLLALVIAAGGVLSAVLVNDIVVFAFSPMLCRGLRRRGLDPRPFLLGLAGAANAGSAATLIGNPQNILIGQVGNLSFFGYTRVALIPAIAALIIVYAVIVWLWRQALTRADRGGDANEALAIDAWLIGKSLLAIAALIVLLASLTHRVVAALAIAGVLLWGRRLSTRALLAKVDGPLLVMIGCLLAITGIATGLPAAAHAAAWLKSQQLLPNSLGPLALFSLAASNTIGNVPAVVLLLKAVPDLPAHALYGLALFSTLAGNFLLTGSLANIIVAERSAAAGVTLRFADFARVGVPITLTSMALAGVWLWALGVL
jgi:Na+/H+ antiporter NhaD/arsenite permease-like protein